MNNKLSIILFLTILFFSCELLVPDKEPPNVSWISYKINSGDFINLDADNLEISPAFELMEFKVKVTDDYSTGEIDKVKLYVEELDSIIYSTSKTDEPDIYVVKWNSTLPQFLDNIYTLKIKAIDSNENEKTSSGLTVNVDQTFGFPVPINLLAVVNNENENCIYWETDSLDFDIPDFTQYNIYNYVADSLQKIHSITDISKDYYCHDDNSNEELFYNVAAIDSFGFRSEMGENLSNFTDHNPIPIDFINIEYTGDIVTFEWEESPDVDFNRYELWYYCDACEFSNIPFYQTSDIEETNFELNLFDSTTNGEFEDLFPNKINEFWIKVYDNSYNLTIGKLYSTQQNYPPNSVNVKSLNYSVSGINIEWYKNQEDSTDFKSYNIYFSNTESSEKVKITEIVDLNITSTFVDSSHISNDGQFSFQNDFNPFNENWFWIGVEDKFGNVSLGSGMTNLIDIPPPAIPISNWTYWKRADGFPNSPDTIIVNWESLENQIQDFESYTIYMSTVSDSIQDTLGSVFDVEKTNFQFPYFWDEIVDCNQSGEIYLWGKTTDAWGQETISESVLFSEELPDKPSITSIYYESIADEYVIEWNKSEDLDFSSYTVYYRHNDAFSYRDVFLDDCSEDINNNILSYNIEDQNENQFIYNLNDDDWTMYFLIVTEDIWGTKGYSTEELDCDPDDPNGSGCAEKATPFNQIIFQSNRELGTSIYSVELDFSNPLFPRINTVSDLSGESFNPSFEPWGSKVVFYGLLNGNYEIFSVGAGGNSTPDNLTNHPGNDYNPQYFADGSKIMFESRRTGNHEIFSMNNDGSNVTQLTYNNGVDNDFQIATNTTGIDKIIYVSTIEGNKEIYLMNENGTNFQNLTNHPENQYDPDISLDGEQIVYIGDEVGQVDLYWENLSTGDSLKLTNNNYIERNPQFVLNGFYPNGEIGNYLVYESDKDGSWSMYFQKLPNYNDDIENFFENNLPINFLDDNSSNQSNSNFANILLDNVEGVYMVFESTEDGTSSIFIIDQFGNHPSAIPNGNGKISDTFGDDFLPQIQP